jgi:site-specific recombinase XerD
LGKKYPIEILTTDEVRAIIRGAGRGRTAPRNRAIIVALWRGGLRAAEVLGLARRDIDLARGTVRVRHGKGDLARTVVLDPEACDVLRVWAVARRRILAGAAQKRAPFFCTLKGGAVHTSYLRAMLPRLAKRAGVSKRVHPHSLRHTYAVELSREAVPLHLISAALGHANVATTSRYISHMESAELLDTMRARPTWAGTTAADTLDRPIVPAPDGEPSPRRAATGTAATGRPKTPRPPSDPP